MSRSLLNIQKYFTWLHFYLIILGSGSEDFKLCKMTGHTILNITTSQFFAVVWNICFVSGTDWVFFYYYLVNDLGLRLIKVTLNMPR